LQAPVGKRVYPLVGLHLQSPTKGSCGSPPGRSYHCAFPGEKGLHVFDVWDSQESFDKFGETLMPIMAELGADPGEPQVVQIHNIIIG